MNLPPTTLPGMLALIYVANYTLHTTVNLLEKMPTAFVMDGFQCVTLL